MLHAIYAGRSGGKCSQRLGESESLVGVERLSLAMKRMPASHCHLNLLKDIGGRYRPIRSHCDGDSDRGQRSKGILILGGLLANERERELGHLRFVTRPQWLQVGSGSGAGEEGQVARIDHLQVGKV